MNLFTWRRCVRRIAVRRLFPASLSFLVAAGTAAAQTPSSYSRPPYLAPAAAQGAATVQPVQGIVVFEEPMPAPLHAPAPVVAPLPAAPLPTVTSDAVIGRVEPEAVCTECTGKRAGVLGRFGVDGRCATCGRDANIPPPLGSYVHSIFDLQANLARQNLFVISLWEWQGDALTPGGDLHLQAMVRKLGYYSFPILVEPSPDNVLNVARQARITNLLHENGLPEARVELGHSTAEGLRSDEIEHVGGRIIAGDGQTGPGVAPPGGIIRPY